MIRPSSLIGLLALALASCSSPEPANAGANSNTGKTTNGAREVPDLGIYNLSAPFDKVLCSGQPTKEQFDTLKAAGVTRVVNLRSTKEKGTGWEEEQAKQSGIEFVRLPIAGKAGLNRENVESFAKLMAAAGDGTTLVSCGSSNRVGAMFALKAGWIDGKEPAEAMAIGRSAGMKSTGKVVEQLLAK